MNPVTVKFDKFFAETQESVVIRTTSTPDTPSLYTGRKSWIGLQSDCKDLRRVRAHLRQGTRPSKKDTQIKDVKRYLQCATVERDGLLVVPSEKPFESASGLIIVPRQILPGLLTSMHLQMSHPSQNQLKCMFKRYFHALDADHHIRVTTESCHQCAALQPCPP